MKYFQSDVLRTSSWNTWFRAPGGGNYFYSQEEADLEASNNLKSRCPAQPEAPLDAIPAALSMEMNSFSYLLWHIGEKHAAEPDDAELVSLSKRLVENAVLKAVQQYLEETQNKARQTDGSPVKAEEAASSTKSESNNDNSKWALCKSLGASIPPRIMAKTRPSSLLKLAEWCWATGTLLWEALIRSLFWIEGHCLPVS